jgi:hypothetical protein
VDGKQARPSHKELTGKLQQARKALYATGFTPVDPLKLGNDFSDLSLFTQEEQNEAISTALLEVSANDYRGLRPPAEAFEQCVRGEEMFDFKWESKFFKRKMYLKFCLVGNELWIFSLHEDRPPRRRLQ